MSRYRTHLLALFGGVLLLALSLSSAFGAHPSGSTSTGGETNRGQEVSDFVHGVLFGDEDANEEEDVTEDENAEEAEDVTEDENAEEAEDVTEDEEVDEEVVAEEVVVEGQPDNHGACVSAVAQDEEAIGDTNENHGGAVSEAARTRITCPKGATVVGATDEEVDEEEAADETAAAGDRPRGKSGDHGGTHGRRGSHH